MFAMVDEPDMVKSPVPEGTYENISSQVLELLHYEIMFTLQQRRQGGVIIHFIICLYAFAALAILCDDYFCASLNKICKRLDIHPDVAGATFMAAGSSMPTMFISVTSVFLDEGDIGLGTIIGSTMFNILFITGICGIAAKMVINLGPYSILRDSSFYFIYLIILLITMYDGMIYWYEAGVVSLFYGFYVLLMYYNTTLQHNFNVWARAHFHQTRHVFESPKKSPLKTALSPALNLSPKSSSKQQTKSLSKSPSNSLTKSTPNLPTISPSNSSIKLPTMTPTKSPSSSPTKSPPNSPTESPSNSSTKSPTKLPTNFPTKSPPDSPTKSPSNLPVNTPSPIKQLTTPPTQSPITVEELELSEDQSVGPITSTPIKKAPVIIEIESDCRLTQEYEELSDVRSVFEEDSSLPHTKYDEEPEDALSCPLGGWARLRWTIMFPIRLLYYFTIPDCRLKNWENWYVMTFITSIIWMGAHSYVLVWAVSVIGATVGLPECIMGLTLLAAGSSVPDAIASLVMARQNMGDMAIANAIGSNIFDMLCLSIPWFFSTTIVHPNSVVMINGGNIVYVSLTLFGTVIVTLVILYKNKWRLDRKLGCAMLTAYVFFLSTAVIIESQPRDKNVKPLHRPDLPHQGLGISHHQKQKVKNTGFSWH